MPTPEQPERIPAAWAEYTALDGRAEYIDGCIVMAPNPSEKHQLASLELVLLLRGAITEPGWRVNAAWAWKAGADEFIPDVMVYQPVAGDRARYTGTPVLCVEILSSNAASDYVTKTVKHAEAGVQHYWIVDPEERTVAVLTLDGGHYELDRTVTVAKPAVLDFDAGQVTVDIAAIADSAARREARACR